MLSRITSSSIKSLGRRSLSISVPLVPDTEETIEDSPETKKQYLNLAMKPNQVVSQLDNFIVGQNFCKFLKPVKISGFQPANNPKPENFEFFDPSAKPGSNNFYIT